MSNDNTPLTLPPGMDDGSPMVVLGPDGWFHLYNWPKHGNGCPVAAYGKRVELINSCGVSGGVVDAELVKAWHLVAKFRIVTDGGDAQPESKLYAPENAKKYNHYFVRVPWSYIDIYRLLELFKVTDNAIGHAVKKLLVPGLRGNKPTKQDIIEARDTLNRRTEMWDEDESVKDDML